MSKPNILSREYFIENKFEKLMMKYPEAHSKGSMKKTWWICDCGKETNTSIYSVTSGHTNSCGKCDLLPKSYWEKARFGKLKMKNPGEYFPGSSKKVEWVCDCGKERKITIISVSRGATSSCGKCDILPKSYWEKTKFGKLRMKNPGDYFKSHKGKVEWICDCGKESSVRLVQVTRGHTNSCGKCDLLPESYWEAAKFGKLRVTSPENLHISSNRKIEWTCDCGGSIFSYVQNVTKGRTTSCGKCRNIIRNWYETNKEELFNLKTPILPESIPSGGLILLERIEKINNKIEAACPACNGKYNPVWSDFRTGRSLTCGCSTNKISDAQKKMMDFIESIGIKTISEYKIDSLKYDIFIEGSNTVIEYNGIRWHSFPNSKKKDVNKYLNAKNSGYEFISIFEDEWVYKQDHIKQLLKNKLGKNDSISLRPSGCEIKLINSKDADPFYEQHHYIGACKAKINYGVFHQDQLIACASFKKPTRQSSHEWELVRMTSHPNYRIHGIWSKLIKQFVEDHKPKSVVSFSDNRLFTGSVYEKTGFKFDGDVDPDYYWCKGQKRFHKSGLRKTEEEKLSGKTETELREAQGYRKIWDLGKKRWILKY
jgi:bacterioferritin-associated ferredoxin